MLLAVQAIIAALPVSAATATGTLYAAGLTAPAGGVWMGTHLWTADQAGPVCRIDIDPATQVGRFNPSTCLNGQTGTREQVLAFVRAAGQPSFDPATNSLYVPDYRQRGAGVWRFTFDPVNETIVPLSGIVLSRNAPLGGARPTATALGPDGDLYVGASVDGNIRRITNPSGPINSQTVQVIGTSLFGHAISGLAFVGADLYIAEQDGLTMISNVATCQSGCHGLPVAGTNAASAMAVASNGSSLFFVQGADVLRYSFKTQTASIFSSNGTLPAGYTANTLNCTAGNCTYTFTIAAASPNGLTLDPSGNLFIGEDPGAPTGGQFQARIWEIPALPAPTITGKPAAATSVRAPSFTFAHVDPTVTFECSLVPVGAADSFAACMSPFSPAPLADGAYTFKVRAVDATGTVTSNPAAYAFTVDTVPPTATITGQPTSPTNDNTPTFAFSANEAGATFQCSLAPAGAVDSFVTCSSPATYPPQTDGAYTFKVNATDAAGNVSAVASTALTIDTIPPVVSITNPPTRPSNVTAYSFAFSANEAGATFQCSFGPSTSVNAFSPCGSPASYGPLANGSYTFRVQATDTAGNLGGATTASLTIDTVPPVVTLTQTPPNPTTGTSATFGFSSEVGATFQCSLVTQGAADAFNLCTSPATFTVGPGSTYVFKVTATDAAGNTSAPVTNTFQVGTAAPPASSDLQVGGSASTGAPAQGAAFTYTWQVKNNSGATAPGVTFTDTLPAGLTFNTLGGAATCTTPAPGANGTVACDLGSMPVGGQATITINVTPTTSGAIGNTGRVAFNGTDTQPTNNASTVNVTVSGQAAPPPPPPPPPPTAGGDVQVTGSASTGSPVHGTNFTYTWQVKNSGNPSTGVVFTDALPAGMAYVNAGSTLGACSQVGGTVTCNVGDMAVGAQATITITVTAPATTGNIANAGKATPNGTDANPANNTFTVTVGIK